MKSAMWRRARYLALLVGLCAIATYPTAHRSCVAKNHAREASSLLTVLGDRIAAYVKTNGRVPKTAAGPTPQPACCARGGACAADAAMWSAPGWRELEFSVDGKFRYTYEYLPDPSGRAAIVRATGDVDCDGITSRYELNLTVTGNQLERAWTIAEPNE